jgi:hypothetical protein
MPPAGALLNLGSTDVVLTAFDLSGNATFVTNSVVVADTTPPVLVCPPDLVVNADALQGSATGLLLGQPTVTDNCGLASVTNDAPSTYLVGTNVVTWTATDQNGNAAAATQLVVVKASPMPPRTLSAAMNPAAGAFTVRFAGTPDAQYTVLVSPDLASWLCVSTNTAGSDGTWTYTDPDASKFPKRFYRSARP